MGSTVTALRNDTYIVIYQENETSEKELVAFPETNEDLYKLLTRLNEMKSKTGQRMSQFSYVLPKGSLYPTEYDQFWAHRNRSGRTVYNAGAPFFVRRVLKNGKTVQKYYNQAEDFDWQFDKWNATSDHILIICTSEALMGNYVYQHDVQKYWGNQTPLFGS